MKIRHILPWFLLVFCAAQADEVTFRPDKMTIETASGERHFSIEIAETPAQQEHGLMFRTKLARNHGMLFMMSRDLKVTLWMKDTLIPLDMLFIDSHGTIVQIAENATPESTDIIAARQPVRAALELAGGTAAMDEIHVGDRVIYSGFER